MRDPSSQLGIAPSRFDSQPSTDSNQPETIVELRKANPDIMPYDVMKATEQARKVAMQALGLGALPSEERVSDADPSGLLVIQPEVPAHNRMAGYGVDVIQWRFETQEDIAA